MNSKKRINTCRCASPKIEHGICYECEQKTASLNKKSMPHVRVKDKDADLYFNYLEPKERQEFFDDLISEEQPTIKLPDWEIPEVIDASNPEVKNINKKDIDKNTEEFIKRFIKDHSKSEKPLLEYDNKQHKYKLKPKYDIEQIIKEFYKKHNELHPS